MQKHVNLVDLVKSFPTNIFLQNLASTQKRTSPIQFAHLAEKSEHGSTSNLNPFNQGGRRRALDDRRLDVGRGPGPPRLPGGVLGLARAFLRRRLGTAGKIFFVRLDCLTVVFSKHVLEINAPIIRFQRNGHFLLARCSTSFEKREGSSCD